MSQTYPDRSREDGQTPSDFAEWIIRSLDGTITAEEFAQLDHEITTNKTARTYYLDFITTYVGLVDLVGVLPKVAEFVEKSKQRNKNTEALKFSPGMSEEEKIRMIERYAQKQLEDFLAQEHTDLYETQFRSAGLDFSQVFDRVTDTAKWLGRKGVRVAKTAAVCSLAALVILIFTMYIYSNRTIATLIDSVDAKWDVDVGKDSRLRPQSFSLKQGYARIVLNKGAEVILQAPSTFKVQTSNKMFLESGWMTAKIPRKAMGFTVKTPQSSVVDYGTEFGLLVGAGSNAEVHVFEGNIWLDTDGTKGANQSHQFLQKGQAAIIDDLGHVQMDVVSDRPRLFTRQIPDKAKIVGIPGKTLDLSDVVGGGMGFGTGQMGFALDPATGQTRARYLAIPQPNRRQGDHQYHRVEGLPFVDGVFVPDGSQQPVTVTSENHRFTECPATSNEYWVDITNDEVDQGDDLGKARLVLNGAFYCTAQRPGINVHPNIGITFDLEAVREVLPDIRIARFEAVCGISESVSDNPPPKADFWVLVDGRVRFTGIGLGKGQYRPVRVELHRQDHFLTLVCTDGGNQIMYDHAVFGEPVLVFESETTG